MVSDLLKLMLVLYYLINLWISMIISQIYGYNVYRIYFRIGIYMKRWYLVFKAIPIAQTGHDKPLV